MSKKLKIIIAVVVGVLLLTIAGTAVVMADEEPTTDSTTGKTLLARVAEILGLEQQQVEDAFAQARQDMQTEALENYLQKLVENDEITPEQAQEYLTWWQSRPDTDQYMQQIREWQQARPGLPTEMKEWRENQPDIPLSGNVGAHGLRGGMMRSGIGQGFCW